ncbi:hypothetical protein BASA81_005046 [Batrachochytrium salamandrivorans]|nr:hypothetical protein BASA81_005046 [Batrachochytrium salamandrivorans]
MMYLLKYLERMRSSAASVSAHIPTVDTSSTASVDTILNAQDQFGRTALHVAVRFNCHRLIYMLLCAGADCSIVDQIPIPPSMLQAGICALVIFLNEIGRNSDDPPAAPFAYVRSSFSCHLSQNALDAIIRHDAAPTTELLIPSRYEIAEISVVPICLDTNSNSNNNQQQQQQQQSAEQLVSLRDSLPNETAAPPHLNNETDADMSAFEAQLRSEAAVLRTRVCESQAHCNALLREALHVGGQREIKTHRYKSLIAWCMDVSVTNC